MDATAAENSLRNAPLEQFVPFRRDCTVKVGVAFVQLLSVVIPNPV